MCQRCDEEWICSRCGLINYGKECDCGSSGPRCQDEIDDGEEDDC